MAYIMIVDDDEDLAEAFAKVLRDARHEVEIEGETAQALERMNRRPPDLVVLDVMFPENSSAGFELARDMRRGHGKLGEIPILMLTAVNSRFPTGFSARDIDEDWLPVTDFVEKPVELDVLVNKVSALLERAASAERSERAG